MTSQQLLNAQALLQQRRQQAGITYRPSLPLGGFALPAPTPAVEIAAVEPTPEPAQLFHHGDIAIAANRAGQSTHYQLWLALRHLDTDGRGWLSQKAAQDAFCSDQRTNETYLYKKTRLRQLVAEGNGVYWRLDEQNQRVFYHRESRIADGLGMKRLTGRHVAIGAAQIFTSIQTFRAHCFAAWLANHTNPISQETIAQLTGIPPRTQLRYTNAANIQTTANLSIGPRYTQDAAQECAWQHGNIFKFADFRGKQGPAGRRYVAWHLPTSYSVTATSSSRRRQKRTNNQMADLRHYRDAGNGRLRVLFFPNGAAAAKIANRQMADGDPRDHYWPGTKARTGTKLWHCLTV